ncbi:MAG: CBS domain-containing protein [Candidatus Omnitrophica bacterium]|nr:CBS domain-containing protein [Candidatus Omnitrophota bacterium]
MPSKDKKIAPKELVQVDFRNLKSSERLNTTPKIEELIFIQSMEGRAHNGAGAFRKRFYVNTSIDDIVKALDRDPKLIKLKRQELIDEIVEFVNRVIAGEQVDRLISKRGTPLLGTPLFKTRLVNPHDILRGIYLGGLRDDVQTRKETEKIYNITIGYGRCYLVNMQVMEKMGLDGEMLAHQEHECEIENFKKEGLIITQEDLEDIGEEKVRYFYIRHKLGPGQSDDSAIVNAGFLYKSVDVALGVFLADAIDTLEKYAPIYSDQDNELSFFIKEKFKKLDITIEEVYRLTYLSTIPEGREEEIPDSSLRYFLTVDPRTGQSTLECHLNFIEGKPFFPMAISYKRILILTFYEYVKERLSEVLKPAEVMPLLTFGEGLDVPIKELIRKKIIVVSPERILSDVLKELRDKKADAIIIQDDRHNILGIVDSSDFLHILERKR